MSKLQTWLANLSPDERKMIDDTLIHAHLAYCATGDLKKAKKVCKTAKHQANGKLRKILTCFQKAQNLPRALDIHFRSYPNHDTQQPTTAGRPGNLPAGRGNAAGQSGNAQH